LARIDVNIMTVNSRRAPMTTSSGCLGLTRVNRHITTPGGIGLIYIRQRTLRQKRRMMSQDFRRRKEIRLLLLRKRHMWRGITSKFQLHAHLRRNKMSPLTNKRIVAPSWRICMCLGLRVLWIRKQSNWRIIMNIINIRGMLNHRITKERMRIIQRKGKRGILHWGAT
jgi:hypothetical protein